MASSFQFRKVLCGSYVIIYLTHLMHIKIIYTYIKLYSPAFVGTVTADILYSGVKLIGDVAII